MITIHKNSIINILWLLLRALALHKQITSLTNMLISMRTHAHTHHADYHVHSNCTLTQACVLHTNPVDESLTICCSDRERRTERERGGAKEIIKTTEQSLLFMASLRPTTMNLLSLQNCLRERDTVWKKRKKTTWGERQRKALCLVRGNQLRFALWG